MASEDWRGHVCIYGTTGYGKSTLAQHLLKGRAKIIRLDHLAKPLSNAVPTTRENINLICRRAKERFAKGFNFYLTHDKADGPVVGLNRVLDLVETIQRNYATGHDPRPLVLLVDEASKSMPNERQKVGLRGVQEWCEQGRHWGVEIIAATQRPARLSPDMRANMEATFAFRLGFEDDRVTVAKIIGRKYEPQLAQLPRFTFLKWTTDGVFTGKTTKRGGVGPLKPA